MARLPIPGSDNGAWGQVLNDFLAVSHATDGSVKANAVDSSALQDNSVSGAKLQDSTVSEAKLDITGGSNGQVLTKNGSLSGGLEWTSVSGAADATTTTKGIVQLAGDLAGTAATPTVPGLASKASTSTAITAGTGLTGGGDLSTNRTISASFGTTAGTIAQGNDSRITGAEQTSNKGVASGYAPLDTSSKVPIANLPATAFSQSALFGLELWTTPLYSATLTYAPGAQTFVGVLVRAATSATLTKLGTWITSAGSLAGAGVNGIGLYSEAGARLAVTGDMTAAFQTTGYVEGTLTSSYAITADTNYYLVFLNNFTNAPVLATNGSSGTYPTIRGHYPSIVAFSQTSFPASVTPSSLTPGNLPIFLTAGT